MKKNHGYGKFVAEVVVRVLLEILFVLAGIELVESLPLRVLCDWILYRYS